MCALPKKVDSPYQHLPEPPIPGGPRYEFPGLLRVFVRFIEWSSSSVNFSCLVRRLTRLSSVDQYHYGALLVRSLMSVTQIREASYCFESRRGRSVCATKGVVVWPTMTRNGMAYNDKEWYGLQ